MNGKLLKCASCKDRDALITFCDFPAEPPAIIGAALGLNIHPGLLHARQKKGRCKNAINRTG